jgi:surface antigen
MRCFIDDHQGSVKDRPYTESAAVGRNRVMSLCLTTEDLPMMRKSFLSITLALVTAASGCATRDLGPNEQVGMVIGGVLGGVIGSEYDNPRGHGRTAAIILGTLVGTAIGGAVGRSMDDVDRLKTAQTLETVRTGVPSSWRNPDTGNRYTVTPVQTYDTASGPCREYIVDAMIGGRTEKVYGTACRQPDGSWKTQN